jgi:CheY-like chemotaxis protein
MIHIRSELGKGTDVEVTLPLEKGDMSAPVHTKMANSDVDEPKPAEAQQCLEAAQKIASGKKISIIRRTTNQTNQEPYEDLGWQCIEKYFTKWFGFEVIKGEDHDPPPQVDLVIAEHSGGNLSSQLFPGIIANRVLLVRDGMTCVQKRRTDLQRRASESICSPVGPYKLARVVVALFRSQASRPTLLRSTTGFDNLTDANQRSSRSSMAIHSPTTSSVRNDSGISSPNTIETNQVTDTTAKRLSQERAKLMKPLDIALASNITSDLALVEQQIRLEPQHRSPSPVPNVTNSSNPPTPNPEPSLHILAVDDNVVNLQLLQRYLGKRPQDIIVTAKNGIEAVKAVREAETAFDVIFMDLSMPNMDGFEATRLIRLFERSLRHREAADIEVANAYLAELARSEEDLCLECRPRSARTEMPRTKSAYIVALTGLASRRDRDEAEESGFDDFLTKPIGFGKIGELLGKLSGEKKLIWAQRNGSAVQEAGSLVIGEGRGDAERLVCGGKREDEKKKEEGVDHE